MCRAHGRPAHVTLMSPLLAWRSLPRLMFGVPSQQTVSRPRPYATHPCPLATPHTSLASSDSAALYRSELGLQQIQRPAPTPSPLDCADQSERRPHSPQGILRSAMLSTEPSLEGKTPPRIFFGPLRLPGPISGPDWQTLIPSSLRPDQDATLLRNHSSQCLPHPLTIPTEPSSA